MLKLGCHVGMSGKEMMLGSVKDAVAFGANTFMLYTGAPQNTRRKDISELRIQEAHELMVQNGIEEFVVHAPYIINLANTVNPAIYEIAVDFLAKEIDRATAMGSQTIVLHPGSHVGEGVDKGIASIVKGLNEVLTADTACHIALETMAGKGSEIGRNAGSGQKDDGHNGTGADTGRNPGNIRGDAERRREEQHPKLPDGVPA